MSFNASSQNDHVKIKGDSMNSVCQPNKSPLLFHVISSECLHKLQSLTVTRCWIVKNKLRAYTVGPKDEGADFVQVMLWIACNMTFAATIQNYDQK